MKEPPTKKDARRDSSIVESLQDCDDRLRAISKCDNKIAKFEEILKQMKRKESLCLRIHGFEKNSCG